MGLSEAQINREAFIRWNSSGDIDDQELRTHEKKMVLVALNERISCTQRKYITMYFNDGMTIYQIADLCEVSPSSVSRGINRGIRTMMKYLQFTSPVFAKVSYTKVDLRRRKSC